MFFFTRPKVFTLGRRKKNMTANLLPLYGSAALAITVLGLFARQNRKSGWKRQRPNVAQAWKNFYSELGIVVDDQSSISPAEWTPVTQEEAIGFSAQMLKLRSALGTGTAVTQDTRTADRDLIHQ